MSASFSATFEPALETPALARHELERWLPTRWATASAARCGCSSPSWSPTRSATSTGSTQPVELAVRIGARHDPRRGARRRRGLRAGAKPEPRGADGGFGLFLVERMASRWGVDTQRRHARLVRARPRDRRALSVARAAAGRGSSPGWPPWRRSRWSTSPPATTPFARSLYLLPVLAIAIRARRARGRRGRRRRGDRSRVVSPLWNDTDGHALPLVTVVAGSAIADLGRARAPGRDRRARRGRDRAPPAAAARRRRADHRRRRRHRRGAAAAGRPARARHRRRGLGRRAPAGRRRAAARRARRRAGPRGARGLAAGARRRRGAPTSPRRRARCAARAASSPSSTSGCGARSSTTTRTAG